MASIWYILIDVSGSMGEGFSSTHDHEGDPFAETGPWKKKLDAAKDVLLRQASRMRKNQEIAILAFDSNTKVIYRGQASGLPAKKINSLRAGSSTNLSSAFDYVASDRSLKTYQSISLIVITDGYPDDLTKTVESAQRLLNNYPNTRIDVILIDDTEKGRETAEEIAINGVVTYAYSELDIASQADSARTVSLLHNFRMTSMSQLTLRKEIAKAAGTPSVQAVRLPSISSLNSKTLMQTVVPLVQVFESLESSKCDISGTPYQSGVLDIHTSSPVQISMEGVANAIRAVVDFITPRGRELRYIERELEQDLKKIEIEREKLKLDTERSLNQRKDRNIEREEALAELEHRIRTRRLKLYEAKYQMALELARQFSENRNYREIKLEPITARIASDIDKFLKLDVDIEHIDDQDM